MSKRKKDIVVHYDEDAQTLTCFSVDALLLAEFRAKALPLETNTSVYQALSPEEAERMFGASIFALVDLHSVKKIGIRDYKSLADEQFARMMSGDAEAASDEAQAKYELALEKIAGGLRSKSWGAMDGAEALLQESAALGCQEAIEYLTTLWPALESRAKRGFR